MILSFDKFERYEIPQVTLCNPNSRATEVNGKITITDTVGVLSNPKGMSLKLNFNAPHELSFDYYRHKSTDPIKQSFYDKIFEAIQTDRYVYLTDIGYFIISNVSDSDEDNVDKTSISLKSCEENEFAVAEGLYLEEGTYYLHTNNNDGLLDLFLPKTAGWTMGYIDPSLLTKPYYVEDTEVDNGYNFLYTTIQDMFECIVEPDIIKRTISVYSRVYYAGHHLTDIHIAKYNLLKHRIIEENDEDKYTALNVQGKDENLEIRAVNPTGKNVIYNFEPRYAWMSPALQDAVTRWQKKCESVEDEYLTLQQGYYAELETLFNEEQNTEVLKGELKTLEETRDAVIITVGDQQSTALNNVNAQIAAKQEEINTATSNYNSHKNTVQANYEEPINKINADCTLGMSIENFVMEIGTINSADGQLSNNKKRIRTANYTILDAGIYTVSNTQNFPVVLYVYDSNNNYLSDLSVTNWSNSPFTFTLDSQYKIKFAIKKSDIDEISISDVSGIEIKKMTGSFAVDIDGNEIFTENLLNELMTHIKPTDYVDEYMLVTESMTYPQRFEKAKELMNRAKSQLVKISSGKKTYSVDTRSFLFNKHFKHFSEQLCAGAIIYVETKKDTMEQLHLTGIDINFDDKSTSFTLGNKYDRSDLKALYEDTLGQHSKSFSELKYIASIIEDQQKELDYQRNWVADLRTLTLDNVLTSENQAIEINNRGLIGRKRQVNADGSWKEDKNGNPLFELEQVKLINNTLVFTEDNWNTASTAVGKIAVGYDDKGNVKYSYGINGQVLIGELILGNNLVLTGTSAGIKIKDSSGNNVFYADENGNLNLTGTVHATDGSFTGTVTASSGAIGGWIINNNALYKDCKLNETTYRAYMQAPSDVTSTTSAFAVKETNKNGVDTWPFYVKYDGSMHATKGNIGGWNIKDGSLYSKSNNGYTMIKSGGAVAFGAGVPSGNSHNDTTGATFQIYHNGKVVASDAEIEGKITAKSGNIGGYTIGKNSLKGTNMAIYSGDGNSGAVIEVGNGNISLYKDGSIEGNIIYGSMVESQQFYVSDSSGNAQMWYNNNALKFKSSDSDYMFLCNNSDVLLRFWYNSGTQVQFRESLTFYRRGNYPNPILGIDNTGGWLHGKWYIDQSFSGSGSAITSDANKKHEIANLSSKYSVLFDNLRPVTYKYNDGTSNRLHTGFIAQEVNDALNTSEISTQDFAGLIIDKPNTDEEAWYLRYEEFVALNTWEIQKLKKKAIDLENTVTELKTQLQTLTAG